MRSRKSKTMWFAFALTVSGALFELFPYLQSLLDPRFYGVSLVVIGIIVAVLRFLTTQPLNEK